MRWRVRTAPRLVSTTHSPPSRRMSSTRVSVRISPPCSRTIDGVAPRDADEVDDPGRRNVQRPQAGGVRLDLAQPLRPDQLDAAGHAVRDAAAVQLLEARQLRRLGRHHHLAADLVRDVVRAAQNSISSRAPSTV